VHVLGARVDDVTWADVLALVDSCVRSGQPHQIMTPNPEYVMRARNDGAFRDLLDRVDLAPADGVGVKWAASLLGETIREVVPGSDLVERMAPAAAARGDRWFLLGAAEGVAAEVGRILTERYPGLVIAGTYAGLSQAEHDDAACRRIEAAMPVQVLLVAYGSPAQDFWIARNQARLKVAVAIGVGGTFNFIAGRSRRPPDIVKRLNLIWLFRLFTEPWRWRRQLVLVRFAGLVVWEAVRRRTRRNPSGEVS
jgi:N-acetylglucosaminyldiphosphoundecaprenol N-acetyl-beta-D-mannosaminyltransferase